VTRSEEIRASSTRSNVPRTRRAGNGSTSTARKPAEPPAANAITAEQPIVKPERVIVDVDGPTWAETIATLATPDVLDPDDIAILSGWTGPAVAGAPAATVDEPPVAAASDAMVDEPPVAEAAASAAVVDEPAVAEEPSVAEAAVPVEPSAAADAHDITDHIAPVVEPPTVEETAAGLAVVAPVAAPEAAVATTPPTLNAARAFTMWRRRRPRVRKVTRVVRRIDTWSVLKVSVIFYVVLFVILLVAGVLLWNLAESTGTVRNIEGFIRDLFNLEKFDVSGRELFRASWTLGIFLVIAGTGLNVTMAVLFNLISDLVGGVRVTVLEEEVVLAPRTVRVADHRSSNAATPDEPVPDSAPLEPVDAP
jgi:Transmembrane domain of unknown function (DUF3566)